MPIFVASHKEDVIDQMRAKDCSIQLLFLSITIRCMHQPPRRGGNGSVNIEASQPRLGAERRVNADTICGQIMSCIISWMFHLHSFSFRSSEEDQLQPVDLNLINDLWVPNVFIYNLKTFKVSLIIIITLVQSLHHLCP